MSARDIILGRVRSGLADAVRTPLHDIPRAYRTSRPTPDLVGLFCERVTDYQAEVQRVGDGAVADAVLAAVRTAGAGRVLTPLGVPDAWSAALTGHVEVIADSDVGTADLDAVDAVVTTAAAGIASTGTIVLDHGPGQGRRAATLVPDVHVCVVEEHQIVDDVPEALGRLDPARPLTFISGPSATSDIELDRVEGVHGPRTLKVLVTP